MDFNEFQESIQKKLRPERISPYLDAMYEDAIGNWRQAHEIAQNIENKMGSLIHAYLHRKEGDTWNARYWYNLAGRDMPNSTLEEEWESITKEILELYS